MKAERPFWLTRDVVEIARGLLQDFEVARLPVLADALEAAGFTDTWGQVWLEHLRTYHEASDDFCTVVNAIVYQADQLDRGVVS